MAKSFRFMMRKHVDLAPKSAAAADSLSGGGEGPGGGDYPALRLIYPVADQRPEGIIC